MDEAPCSSITDCLTPTLCTTTGTCKGGHIMPAQVRVSAASQALDALFRENAIPMSDRNARLYVLIQQGLDRIETAHSKPEYKRRVARDDTTVVPPIGAVRVCAINDAACAEVPAARRCEGCPESADRKPACPCADLEYAAHELLRRCDDADDAGLSTLSTKYVREVLHASGVGEMPHA